MKENNFNPSQPEGEYTCLTCGTHLDLDKSATLPPCPVCGNNNYKKETL